MNEILDGTGDDNRARVDSRNRLFTDSISRSQLEYAILVGDGYNVSTGSITLTTDSESAVGYFKYNGNDTLVIKEILVIIGDSTGGSGSSLITLVKNPDSGTIVSNAVNVSAASNRNFASFNQLEADAYKGAEGDTLLNGETFAVTSRGVSSEVVAFDAAPIVLKRGNSIGVKFTPPSGSTSQNIVVAGTIYVERVDI